MKNSTVIQSRVSTTSGIEWKLKSRLAIIWRNNNVVIFVELYFGGFFYALKLAGNLNLEFLSSFLLAEFLCRLKLAGNLNFANFVIVSLGGKS